MESFEFLFEDVFGSLVNDCTQKLFSEMLIRKDFDLNSSLLKKILSLQKISLVCLIECLNQRRFDVGSELLPFTKICLNKHNEELDIVLFLMAASKNFQALDWILAQLEPSIVKQSIEFVGSFFKDCQLNPRFSTFSYIFDACRDPWVSKTGWKGISLSLVENGKWNLIFPYQGIKITVKFERFLLSVQEAFYRLSEAKWCTKWGIFPKNPTSGDLIGYCRRGNYNILKWIFENSGFARDGGIHLVHSPKCIDAASKYGQVKILQLWREVFEKWGIPFRYSRRALSGASRNGHIEVLNWWVKSKFPLKLELVCQLIQQDNLRDEVKSWWKDYYFDQISSEESIFSVEILMKILENI